jgi:hypothetical protein
MQIDERAANFLPETRVSRLGSRSLEQEASRRVVDLLG